MWSRQWRWIDEFSDRMSSCALSSSSSPLSESICGGFLSLTHCLFIRAECVIATFVRSRSLVPSEPNEYVSDVFSVRHFEYIESTTFWRMNATFSNLQRTRDPERECAQSNGRSGRYTRHRVDIDVYFSIFLLLQFYNIALRFYPLRIIRIYCIFVGTIHTAQHRHTLESYYVNFQCERLSSLSPPSSTMWMRVLLHVCIHHPSTSYTHNFCHRIERTQRLSSGVDDGAGHAEKVRERARASSRKTVDIAPSSANSRKKNCEEEAERERKMGKKTRVSILFIYFIFAFFLLLPPLFCCLRMAERSFGSVSRCR